MQIEAGKPENGHDVTRILELAQNLAQQYVGFSPSQKRQVVDSVFLNLRLDTINLCGDYRLPFAILVENRNSPVNSG